MSTSAAQSTRAALISTATAHLDAAHVPDAARDARLLMRWACGLDGAGLAAEIDAPCPKAQADRFNQAVARRAAREPLSHITGSRAFWDRNFAVTPDVLDPRPETETLIAKALEHGPVNRVLDLGTGSGCLIVTLLAEWPGALGVATDLSPKALAVARRNAVTHGVTDRVSFVETAWTNGLTGPFDLIVSNPPYLAANEMPTLAPEVRLHEPRMALTPEGDGLGAYRAIARGAPALLAPGAAVVVEIGPTQADAVATLFTHAGLTITETAHDLDQRPRVVIARA